MRKRQMLGVHDPKSLDVGEPELDDALLCLAQHGLGDVDAAKAVGARIVRQRYAGADPHLEDASADAFGGGDRGVAATLENRAEHEIINRRPARIRLGDRLLVELCARQIGHGSVSFSPTLCSRPHQPRAVAAIAIPASDSRYPPVATFWICPMN